MINPGENPTITSPKAASYSEYRDMLDGFDGMMRRGVYSEHMYHESLEDSRTVFRELGGLLIPAMVSNNVAKEYDNLFVGEDALLTHAEIVRSSEAIPEGVVVQRQTVLPDYLVEKILTEPTTIGPTALTGAFTIPRTEQIVAQTGLPDYMIFSAYDTAIESEMKHTPAPDILSRDGHLVTPDRDKILDKLDELTVLHEDVFKRQAMQIGYYGGLDAETIERYVQDPDFIPVAALDKVTGEPLMFAIFSADFTDYSTIDWLNPSRVEELKNQKDGNVKTALSLPLVITSRMDGLGLFASTVQVSAHEAIYRGQADLTYLMYESNALSIQFTPKIINKTLGRMGVHNVGTVIEATHLSKTS